MNNVIREAQEKVCTLTEITQRAIELWCAYMGIDPENEKDWHLAREAEEIGDAQRLDDEALTAYMILREKVRREIGSRSVTLMEALEEGAEVERQITEAREVYDSVHSSVAWDSIFAFQEKLREAATAADILEACEPAIEDTEELGYLRRDALVSRDTLKIHTFRHGERAEGTLKQNYKVLKFWNIQSAIQAAMLQPENGISLCLIRDPVATSSYFIFLVRDGDNITVWTDVEQSAHPLQKFMRRCPGRLFSRRIAGSRFPYQLFEFTFSDDGKQFTGEKSKKNALVPINAQAVVVCGLEDLKPYQALWTLMMFNYISEHGHKKKLSYTGAGTVTRVKDKMQLMVPGTHEVPYLTHADLKRNKLSEIFDPGDEDGYTVRQRTDPTGRNNWLEDRYEDRVPEEAYNLVGRESQLQLTTGEKAPVEALLQKPKGDWGSNKNVMVSHAEGVQVDAFGTPEQMEADRRWLARYNKAKYVQKFANEEYEERREGVLAWVDAKIKANADYLIDAAARGTLIVREEKDPDPRNPFVIIPEGAEEYEESDILSQKRYEKTGHPFGWCSGLSGGVLLYKMRSRGRDRCYVSGKAASIWTQFQPRNAAALALLCGCEVQDLPDVLHHWTTHDRYHGNSILDRLDPMDGHLENPWNRHLGFEIILGLAKSTFNKLRKDRGLPKKELEETTHDRY